MPLRRPKSSRGASVKSCMFSSPLEIGGRRGNPNTTDGSAQLSAVRACSEAEGKGHIRHREEGLRYVYSLPRHQPPPAARRCSTSAYLLWRLTREMATALLRHEAWDR